MALGDQLPVALKTKPLSFNEKVTDVENTAAATPLELTTRTLSPITHLSSPTQYGSPSRQHTRAPSTHRKVKETLNARSEYTNSQDDGVAQHRINQYLIKEEIGRGSYGAVHLAEDQYGQKYAVKEFSKSRLRRRAQSNILRRPRGGVRKSGPLGAMAFAPNMFRRPLSKEDEKNPLYLIKEEIAIMKKLNHPSLVSLIEVLDDPDEDSLYMVLEYCQKGVIMKVGIEERADPYDEELCRTWFRDLLLGIEYLHAQGIIHRDIKPDNLLLTEDDVLKVVDFGVSEMFEKSSEMFTEKSAGSPAFLPPELCIARHGEISGKAADIWSMGVTLYCLRFGHIPFEKDGVLDLYESIKNDDYVIDGECSEQLQDLLSKILEKNPAKRITMEELREHPWVTKLGTDPLLSAEENTADIVETPTEEEVNSAITGNMKKLLVVMQAVKKFKNLNFKRHPYLMGDFLTTEKIVQPPSMMKDVSRASSDAHVESGSDRTHQEDSAVSRVDASPSSTPPVKSNDATPVICGSFSSTDAPGREVHERPSKSEMRRPVIPTSGKGQAQDPLSSHLFLHINAPEDEEDDVPIVSESPPAADIDIYASAYRAEIEQLRAKGGQGMTLYLTKRVDGKQEFMNDESLIGRLVGAEESVLERAERAGQKVQEALDRLLGERYSKLGMKSDK